MAVSRAEHFEQGNGFRVRLNPLPWAIRHIGDRAAVGGNGVDAGSLGNEIENHLVVTAGCGVVKGSNSACRSSSATTLRLCLLLNQL